MRVVNSTVYLCPHCVIWTYTDKPVEVKCPCYDGVVYQSKKDVKWGCRA